MTPLLHTERLTRTYEAGRGVTDVELSLDRGERLVVLGHNGAGKSTLLELVATLRTPTRGTVRIDGIEAGREPRAARRLLALTPQANALDPTATPREVVRFQGRASGMGRAEASERAQVLLTRFGLDEHADRRIAKLSGGTRRKVDLAVALIGSPALLILDEPTTGLDPVARQEFHAALRTLSENGTAVLVSTQDLHEAEQLATRILVLREGRVVADDTAARLKARVGDRVVVARGRDPEALAEALAPTVTVHCSDEGVTVPVGADTDTLATTLRALAHRVDLVDDLRVTAPSLDDVFLALAVR